MNKSITITLVLIGILLASGCDSNQVENPKAVPETQKATAANTSLDSVLPLPVGFKAVYRIEKTEDVSFASVSRIVLRVSLPSGLSRSDIELNLKHAARELYASKHSDAIEVFAYRQGEPTNGVYSVAHCTFAPYGKWERAMEKPPLEKYATLIEFNDAYFIAEPKPGAVQAKEVQETINGWKVTVLTYIPEDKRRAIFYDLVKAQDSGVGDERTYDVIAKKYKLKREEVSKIGSEGAVKRWPMP